MVCTAVTLPTSPGSTGAKDIFREYNSLHRSDSAKDLRKGAAMQRSSSDNSLCYSVKSGIRAAATQPKLKNSPSVGIFPFKISSSIIPNSLKSFLFDSETSNDASIEEKETRFAESSEEISEDETETKRAYWVERLMEIRKQWVHRQQQERVNGESVYDEDGNSDCDCDSDEGCQVSYDSEDEEESEVTYNRESFSKLLVQVNFSDTKLFEKLAYLSYLAYTIPDIKAKDLSKIYDLQFVTSSLEKKAEAEAIKLKLDQDSTCVPVTAPEAATASEKKSDTEQTRPTRPYVASKIAASAASYVQSRANLLSIGCETEEGNGQREGGTSPGVYRSEVAAYVAASTMTAVVAAGEQERHEAAKNLQSLASSPCEWFICDDSSTYTRYFVIQGSDSLASWQANLFFEPTKFEETDVLVHRGIYEAAKGIFQQFLPEIMEHLSRHGDRAKLQFTGHSLGGSLSLLVNLMLLTRKVVNSSTLRPVVTFGSPFVFCGGQKILNDLGLDESHVHSVMMHRDIVPRAFSCNYPNHVALVLKRLNGSFRSHPCLNKNKLLYSPLGKVFILQPNETSSPTHPLLPPGNALYALDKTKPRYSSNALRSFINCPHPLETLSDPSAYGAKGSILRDHDSKNYLKAMNGVLKQHTKIVFRIARRQRQHRLWPLITDSTHSWRNTDHLQNQSNLATNEVMTGA